jgi:hypothetical protein
MGLVERPIKAAGLALSLSLSLSLSAQMMVKERW